MKTFTGGCLCKQVRFEISAEPIAMRLCWCRDCQYFAAGNAVIVRNGALDDTGLLKPGATIWTTSAPEWAWIDDGHPTYPEQPPPVA